MREMVQRRIISVTVNNDNGINGVAMINADGGSSFGPTIARRCAFWPGGTAASAQGLRRAVNGRHCRGIAGLCLDQAMLIAPLQFLQAHVQQDGRRGVGGGGRVEEGENRGDKSMIIPSRRGRGGRRYVSSTGIVNKADDNNHDDGICCISLDLAMLGYHYHQRQPRRQWPSWLASSMARGGTDNFFISKNKI